jgi:hypothetical protein
VNSKEEIRDALLRIADNYKMRGEAVEMAVELVTFALFHEQVAIANTAKEMSLTEAALIDSKIAQCANVMYSVFRGRCPMVRLNLHFTSTVNKFKLDPLYEGNTFNLYAANPMTETPDGTDDSTKQVEAILSKSDLVDRIYDITKDNYMGLEVTDDDGNSINDISEDIVVQVLQKNEGMGSEPEMAKEYAVTRIFSDHCKSVGDDEMIFALTTPGFGVRLYKKGNFTIGTSIRVKAVIYTPLSDINADAIRRISISGATLMESRRMEDDPDNPSERTEVVTPAIEYDGEVERPEVNSIPYLANYAGRVEHQIKSNSDVNYFFSEVFIDKVMSSTFKFFKKGSVLPDNYGNIPDEGDAAPADCLYIWYIKKKNAKPITGIEADQFVTNYGTYFLENNIFIQEATEIKVALSLNVVLDSTETISEDVDAILETDFNHRLGASLNSELLRAKIAKLTHLKYIKEFVLEADNGADISQPLPPGQYYTVETSINYTLE